MCSVVHALQYSACPSSVGYLPHSMRCSAYYQKIQLCCTLLLQVHNTYCILYVSCCKLLLYTIQHSAHRYCILQTLAYNIQHCAVPWWRWQSCMSHALPDILMMLTIYDHHVNDALLVGDDAHYDTCHFLTPTHFEALKFYFKEVCNVSCDKTM